jgi:hypothetical protein
MGACAERLFDMLCLVAAAACCAAAAGGQAFNPYAKMQGQQDNPYAVSMALVSSTAPFAQPASALAATPATASWEGPESLW